MTALRAYGATVEAAARDYIARRDRTAHPAGHTDNAGRWYPSDRERQDCCASVRSPSRSYPWSYMHHCRTAGHVAALRVVDVRELRAAVRMIEPPKRSTACDDVIRYKAVAETPDHRYVSIYDGVTEYEIGRTMHQQVRGDHGGGYYVYASMREARNADVPESSVAAHLPRVILAVMCRGIHATYGGAPSYVSTAGRKYAYASITPIRMVSIISDPPILHMAGGRPIDPYNYSPGYVVVSA